MLLNSEPTETRTNYLVLKFLETLNILLLCLNQTFVDVTPLCLSKAAGLSKLVVAAVTEFIEKCHFLEKW